MIESRPVLNGLVLAGGRSTRMGEDKGAINWHGKEQRLHIADMLQSLCNEVFISCRKDQQIQNENYRTIIDVYEDAGPLGAILSAFKKNRDCPWLIVACDLPLLDAATLLQLVQERDAECMATAFNGAEGLPEPLVAIWEPKAFPILLSSFLNRRLAPQKVLIENPVKTIQAENECALMNVNTPTEMKKAKEMLSVKE